MKLCVVGTGYVGLVAGTCLADMGHEVVCVDTDAEKVRLLTEGVVPIYEPGLDHLIERNVENGRLSFTTDGDASIGAADVTYIAVGTPSAADGSCDLSAVLAVAAQIGGALTGPSTVIIKSTVPVGTADRVRAIIAERTEHAFDVVSNPEFLKEGAALDDFTHPDRIIVGCKHAETQGVMNRLYAPLVRTGKPILFMDNRSAELSKYAANAFLATKISFINELALLCEQAGADVDAVRRGAGTDSRIGLRFFFPGVGYGGSCFPKDVKALIATARSFDFPLQILDAVESVNGRQKQVLGKKILRHFGSDLTGKRIAIWGLSFKPETDDMREAPSKVLIEQLVAAGATVVAHDPEAMEEAAHELPESVVYAERKMQALEGADALVLVTEWNAFRSPNWDEVEAAMKAVAIFDGRNIYDPEALRARGFHYECIGRP